MKHRHLLLLAALVCASCNDLHEPDAPATKTNTAPDRLVATIEEPAADARTYVEAGTKVRWTQNDEISFFPATTDNLPYRFEGETGSAEATFRRLTEDALVGEELACNYAIYPYSEQTTLSAEGVITYTLPAEQSYALNSFGAGANPMVAVTADREDQALSFKNVCGYLKLQLYGNGVTVKRIVLQGNKREPIAGEVQIRMSHNTLPSTTLSENGSSSITLNCDEGVVLSSNADAPTAFWFVIPAITFDSGFTITVTDDKGRTFTKFTTNSVQIDRSMVLPMQALSVSTLPETQRIRYTATGKVDIHSTHLNHSYGAKYVSNEWNKVTGEGIITFDANITLIPNRAFDSNSALTSITLPAFATSIGEYAFKNCTSLQSIELPSELWQIGTQAFALCTSLKSIDIPGFVEAIPEKAFLSCSSLESITFPEDLKSVGANAFTECYQLKSSPLPDTVDTIGELAFSSCEALTHFTIPASLTTISANLFDGCSALSEITIPDTVEEIKSEAFMDCGLKQATIGKNVKRIEARAFAGCTELQVIYCLPITPPEPVTIDGEWNAFDALPEDFVIYVPQNAGGYWYDYDEWKKLDGHLRIMQ